MHGGQRTPERRKVQNVIMKILLTTLNSKYVHSNLALKYLYTVVADQYSEVDVREFTINNDSDFVYSELVRANYDMVCFSCYIWNIEHIRILGENLKAARPELLICLGGPEVSYLGHEFARQNPWADYILCGEGEYSFYRFCQVLNEPSEPLETVPGLIYRRDGKIFVNGTIEPMDFNSIPFPYSVLDCEKDRVVYYESSRGCPFSCSYCLSSAEKTVRCLNLQRVKSELGYFLYKNVMQVKFIDRTFNFDKARAKEIVRYIIDNDNGVTNFHFEICADLLDDEFIELFGKARKGLFDLEIGIQSANPQTLKAINRNENVYPVLYNTEKLIKCGNLHIHVDLIAGLPYETYELFSRSFDKVYSLRADALQLGFLKVLKGTPIYSMLEEHEIVYRKHAPYEVISTRYISAEELVRLKMIENMVDIYYNRGGFTHTLDLLIDASGKGAFGLFERLADFYYSCGYQNRDRKKEDQYRIIKKFSVKLAEEGVRTENGTPVDIIAAAELDRDMQESMNPEIYKRFIRKGWEI